ncbi:MAG: divalent-cation tolerance protein CutA [Bauldia sp.]
MTATGDQAGAAVSVYVTFPDAATAESVGAAIVAAGLAACVNIVPGVRSIYRWKGVVERAEETVAFFKTRADLADRLTAAVAVRHAYETPAILVLPIIGGDARYLDWITAETQPGPAP